MVTTHTHTHTLVNDIISEICNAKEKKTPMNTVLSGGIWSKDCLAHCNWVFKLQL